MYCMPTEFYFYDKHFRQIILIVSSQLMKGVKSKTRIHTKALQLMMKITRLKNIMHHMSAKTCCMPAKHFYNFDFRWHCF